MDSYRDSLYVDVAKGFHEQSSAFGMVFTFVILMALFAMQYMFADITISRLARRLKPQQQDSIFSLELSAALKVTKFLTIIYFIIVLFTLGWLQYKVMSTAYANDAITHYSQLRAILAPSLTIQEQAGYDSQFAQISSKADYVVMVTELTAKAKANQLKVPEFEPW